MDTPILDFVRTYAAGDAARLHMPGHKGAGPLGCEIWDITEIPGADDLSCPSGIIARAEAGTTALFSSRRTVWGTGGSTQCIKAMLYLALKNRGDRAPLVLAGRNAHKAFLHAAALLDLDVRWLWPEGASSLCACPITAAGLEDALRGLDAPPFAVYITSPDYLGNLLDVAALARVAHAHGVPLLVDNAHGAYLHFLTSPCHPLDQGADLCCDSAHKTLPVLTGGAYLHIGCAAPEGWERQAKEAMDLFGTTSPSYLTLASLDACNAWLAGAGPEQIRSAAARLAQLKAALAARGWEIPGQEPLKLTLAAPGDLTGTLLADRLRADGVECEYADPDFLVCMVSGHTDDTALSRLGAALAGISPVGQRRPIPALPGPPQRSLPLRTAVFAPSETVPLAQALGRICAAPTVSCPPAVPIVISGERIDAAAIDCMAHYGIAFLRVVIE